MSTSLIPSFSPTPLSTDIGLLNARIDDVIAEENSLALRSATYMFSTLLLLILIGIICYGVKWLANRRNSRLDRNNPMSMNSQDNLIGIGSSLTYIPVETADNDLDNELDLGKGIEMK